MDFASGSFDTITSITAPVELVQINSGLVVDTSHYSSMSMERYTNSLDLNADYVYLGLTLTDLLPAAAMSAPSLTSLTWSARVITNSYVYVLADLTQTVDFTIGDATSVSSVEFALTEDAVSCTWADFEAEVQFTVVSFDAALQASLSDLTTPVAFDTNQGLTFG